MGNSQDFNEPVAWTYEWKHRLHGGSLNVSRTRWPESHLWIETPLYTAPPQRKPLTEEEIRDLLEAEFLGRDGKRSWDDDLQVFRLAERAQGIT